MIFTVMVQFEFAASEPPVSETNALAATADTVPPPQLPTTPGVAATCIPTNISVKLTLVSGAANVLAITSVMTVV